jgi:hypothetical protein
MSLSETREILDIARQIMDILNNTSTAASKVEEKVPVVEKQLGNFRQLERLAIRYLALTNRMGLPSDITAATQRISQLIVMLRMLQISLSTAAGGPVGLLTGIAGVIGTALTVGELTNEYMSEVQGH